MKLIERIIFETEAGGFVLALLLFTLSVGLFTTVEHIFKWWLVKC